MSFQYSPDLSALAERPDVEVSFAEEPAPGGYYRLRRLAVAAGLFLGVTFAIAVVLFIPVLVFNLGRIEALEIAGQIIPASVFAAHFSALFWGTFILALAFTSFVVSLLLFASDRIVRPRPQPKHSDEALMHLSVLRLSGSER
jgi:hypothetical protein